MQTKNSGSSNESVRGLDVLVIEIISLSLCSMLSFVIGMCSHGSPSLSDMSCAMTTSYDWSFPEV